MVAAHTMISHYSEHTTQARLLGSELPRVRYAGARGPLISCQLGDAKPHSLLENQQCAPQKEGQSQL